MSTTEVIFREKKGLATRHEKTNRLGFRQGKTYRLINELARIETTFKQSPNGRVSQDLKTTKNITKTSPCNEHPLTPHFYIVKLGITGVYIFSFILLQNIDCGYSLEPPY